MEKLDITSLKNALARLNSILIRYEKDGYDADIRDAVIQRFEFTYSITLSTIIRFINMQAPEVLPSLTFNEIIRTANKLGLLKGDLTVWTNFRQKRNATSPTYDENIANEVVSIVPQFRDEAEFVLKEIEKRA